MALKANQILPGTYYWVANIYAQGTIQVLIEGPSKDVADHWVCRDLEGKRRQFATEFILSPVRKDE